MPRNIEAKFQIESHEKVRVRAAEIADAGPVVIDQVDYFFPVPYGRLKLRVQESSGKAESLEAELIAYQRSDTAEARLSDYQRITTCDPDGLREALLRSLGEGPVVRKRRELYLNDRTRIHLDSVEGLGCFVEIEVVLDELDQEALGQAVFVDHVQRLGLDKAQIVEVAYADLLTAPTGESGV